MFGPHGVRAMTRRIVFASLFSLLAASPAFAQAKPDMPAPPVAPTPAEPEQPVQPVVAPQPGPDAMRPPTPPVAPEPPATPPPAPTPSPGSPTFVKGKTELTFYGFMQLYGIYDSTQGLNEQAQNTAIARPGTYAGAHGQSQLSARHSRLGLKLAQPVSDDIKATAQFEMDFLGNQPANPPTVTESAFYQNATFRFRHVFAKLETPVVDIVGGQWWSLFGWQSYFHPNSVEIMGLPGQAYKRVAQVRFAKTIKGDAVNVDLAIAAQRPPQRASATPDGVAGVKLTFNNLKGWRTRGANDSGLDAAAIGVSGIGRRFAVDEFAASPKSQVVTYGYGASIDAMVPIIPATKESHGNALTMTGSFVQGAGIEDQYDGLTFGVSNPSLPNPGMANPAPAYTANIDNGLAMFTSDGSLHAVKLQTYMVGAQYYLPGSGKAWLSLNYTHTSSDNAADLGNTQKVWTKANYFDANLFVDVTPGVRAGLMYSRIDQTFAAASHNETDAVNNRVTGTLMLLF